MDRRRRHNSRGGSGRKFYGKRRGGGNRGRSRGKKIHPSKYVSKGTSQQEEAPTFESQTTFNDLPIADIVKQNIAKKGYTKPTEIQDKTIPLILNGRDVIGIASTGSGKTDAFIIPMAHKVISDESQKCLIIAPTRELAIQIEKEIAALVRGTKIQTVVTIGGVNINPQIHKLKRNHQFVVATPGRLKDLHDRRAINLKKFNNIVLDEVDRMLDMGFVNEIKYIISLLSESKQTAFFSATMSKQTEEIARSLLINPERIQIEAVAPHKNIHQDIVKIGNPAKKMEELVKILNSGGYEKTLVFGRTKRGCDKLSKNLYKQGFKTDAIHGDKSQHVRQKVLKKFRDNKINILVATDVAARGIHVNDIDLVVNFDEPESYDDYIHRIGRTGRAGKVGNALTFVH